MTDKPAPADFFSTIHVTATSGDNTVPSAPPAPTGTDPQLLALMQLLIEQNRELVQLSRRQLELALRMEDRYEKQMAAQREEFVRWIQESPSLAKRGKLATEAVRNLLGKLIDDLVEYVGDHQDDLIDSEFVRNDMVDRYGQSLNHISAMYGMLKRLATIDDGPQAHG